LTAPARITKAEFEAAILAAKAAGAARVVFDGGRIVVDLKGDVDGEPKGEKVKTTKDEWGDAA
jgi:hypothetical protein